MINVLFYSETCVCMCKTCVCMRMLECVRACAWVCACELMTDPANIIVCYIAIAVTRGGTYQQCSLNIII